MQKILALLLLLFFTAITVAAEHSCCEQKSASISIDHGSSVPGENSSHDASCVTCAGCGNILAQAPVSIAAFALRPQPQLSAWPQAQYLPSVSLDSLHRPPIS